MLQCVIIDLYFVLTLVCDSLIVSANCMVCTTTEFGKQVEGTENRTHPCRCTVCAVLCFCVLCCAACCVSVCCAVLRAVFLCAVLCCVLCFCAACHHIGPPPPCLPPHPLTFILGLSMLCACVCVCFFFLPPPPPHHLHQSVLSETQVINVQSS